MELRWSSIRSRFGRHGLASRPQSRKDEKDEKDEIEKEVNEVEESMMNIPLNQIFYGPPGTGKTYHTVNAALEILDNEFYQANKDDRQSLKNRFDELKQGGQIGVVTFHQSFGYEEFVEGIRR